MQLTNILLSTLTLLPSGTLAWGAYGHETVAYIASNFVAPSTATYFKSLLGDTSANYLASVAAFADSYRSTTAGRFSAPFHYVDARDSPPSSCSVNFDRDCGADGCVISAIANYVRFFFIDICCASASIRRRCGRKVNKIGELISLTGRDGFFRPHAC